MHRTLGRRGRIGFIHVLQTIIISIQLFSHRRHVLQLQFILFLLYLIFVMVVPWRFRSDGCKFSEEDWECLRTTIIRSLHLNLVGLGGPLAHGTEWDDWFENLLYAGGIGEKYWGESQGREWIFPRDKTA